MNSLALLVIIIIICLIVAYIRKNYYPSRYVQSDADADVDADVDADDYNNNISITVPVYKYRDAERIKDEFMIPSTPRFRNKRKFSETDLDSINENEGITNDPLVSIASDVVAIATDVVASVAVIAAGNEESCIVDTVSYTHLRAHET